MLEVSHVLCYPSIVRIYWNNGRRGRGACGSGRHCEDRYAPLAAKTASRAERQRNQAWSERTGARWPSGMANSVRNEYELLEWAGRHPGEIGAFIWLVREETVCPTLSRHNGRYRVRGCRDATSRKACIDLE